MAKFVKGDVVVVPFPFSDLTQAKQPSNIRPNRIFTADSHIVLYRVGNLTIEKLAEVIEKVIEIIQT